MSESIQCPFCKEPGFDLVGLKHHLENHCEVYESTLTIEEEAKLRKIKELEQDKFMVCPRWNNCIYPCSSKIKHKHSTVCDIPFESCPVCVEVNS